MSRELIRFSFHADIARDELEGTLLLAVLAVAALVGEAAVQIEGKYTFDAARGVCLIDAGTDTGRSIAKVFTGLATKEFGADSFEVERVTVSSTATPAA